VKNVVDWETRLLSIKTDDFVTVVDQRRSEMLADET